MGTNTNTNIKTNNKKHFFQVDKDGVLHIAFVGTEEELQEQINKDFEKEIKKAQEEKLKAEKELSDLLKNKKLDFEKIEIDDLAVLRQFVQLKSKILQIDNALSKAKCPSVNDGTYFVLEKIGKDLALEERI